MKFILAQNFLKLTSLCIDFTKKKVKKNFIYEKIQIQKIYLQKIHLKKIQIQKINLQKIN